MDEVVILSSDSDKDDSDVEIIGSYSNVLTRAESLPLSAVRVDVGNVPPLYIDLTDPKWSLPGLKMSKGDRTSTALTAQDLTETTVENGTKQDTESLPPDHSQTEKEVTKSQPAITQNCNMEESTLNDPPAPQDCEDLTPDESSLVSPTQHQKQTDKAHCYTPVVKLTRIPFLETAAPETSVYLNKDDARTLQHLGQITSNCNHVDATPTSEHALTENNCDWQLELNADRASNGSEFLNWSIPSEPPMDDGSEDLNIDSTVASLWQEESDGDEVNKEGSFNKDFSVADEEDRHYVCPIALKKIMSGSVHPLLDEEDIGIPEMLCRQSLSLVYTTIDENYPEGTLQLLFDLLQPGYFPPRDITCHLLNGILLNPQCPYHQCVQAFNLLMKTQRHHMTDKSTVPWDWELLVSVIANQDPTKRQSSAVVRIFLDYVVQTLEDDFQAKRSVSALHHSIAMATLSCNEQFHRVREVIKWLFSAILKSTELGKSAEAAKEKDEQIRMVLLFQRMLTLALEVDRSPALNSAKLSQELFHMLISDAPLRAHRMLLLDSLQSKLLTCKLLEHLLDYKCPQKIPQPMSLGLLLHFLKFCTLAPDPSDGTEKWQKWEELIHLLWMLLLSYNKAMKGEMLVYAGYLSNMVPDQKGRAGYLVYKPGDMVSKPNICEAVETFLSRSKADLGQALPLHVEESLSYLQDHLLDVCQC